MTDVDSSVLDDGRMTIWAHLAELRTRLIRCTVAIVVGMAVGFMLYPYLLEFLRAPMADLPGSDKFFATDPLEPFATRIKIAAYSGFVLAMPVLLWQIWRFVTPGLYPKEKRYAVPFVVSAIVLFICGATIAYYTLNPTLIFLQGMGAQQVEPIYSVDSYVTLISLMMLAFGAGFQFPVLLVALQFAGVLTPRKLISWWRSATVIITIVAAVITPSGDPISMLALAIPMLFLYVISIVLGLVIYRRKRKRAEKAGKKSKQSEAATSSTS
jgi:sec-independent protein translocase protein TatC